MSKKNRKNSNDTFIKSGYIDNFYCYKISNENQYLDLIKKLKSLKCTIVNFDISTYGDLSHSINETFDKFLKNEALIEANDIIENIEKNLKKDFSDQKLSLKIIDSEEESDTYESKFDSESRIIEKFSIDISSPLEIFIKQKINSTSTMIKENNKYLNKNTNLFSCVFLLQPLKIIINNLEYFINIKATIYQTGNLILQYSIPIIDLNFFDVYSKNQFKKRAFVPKYIINENYDNYNYENDFDLYSSINLYNKFIINKLNIPISNSSFFENYTLIDYDNKPNDFNSASTILSRDLFWLSNSPYGFINERENYEYQNFIKNRYSISIYSNLFVSTNSRTVIAFSNKKPTEEEISNWFEDNENKYFISITYITLAIEIIMIKQTYYKEIANFKIKNAISLKKLINEYNKILYINNFLFHVTFEGYGSISRLIEYLESNLIDFLPQKNIENLIQNYKEIISLKESELNDKKNYKISLIALLFPILFGLEAIEKLTESLDSYIALKYTDFSIKLENYNIQIWIGSIIFILLLIYKDDLFNIVKRINKKNKG